MSRTVPALLDAIVSARNDTKTVLKQCEIPINKSILSTRFENFEKNLIGRERKKS